MYASTVDIYTLSLHDALPISSKFLKRGFGIVVLFFTGPLFAQDTLHLTVEQAIATALQNNYDIRLSRNDSLIDRKSTRLNSSHVEISYAVFCLKKKS